MKYLITVILVLCMAFSAIAGDLEKDIEVLEGKLSAVKWEFNYITERQKVLAVISKEMQKELKELKEKQKAEKASKEKPGVD